MPITTYRIDKNEHHNLQHAADVPRETAQPAPAPPYDVVTNIMDHEAGLLGPEETIVLFSHLVKTGLVWSLQGTYGRAANALIDHGVIASDGTILANISGHKEE